MDSSPGNPQSASPDEPVTGFILDTASGDLFEFRRALVAARLYRPDATTIVLITPGTDVAIAESARELADETVEGHLSDLPEDAREALLTRASAGRMTPRDPVLEEKFVRYLPLMMAADQKIPHGPDDEVARAISDMVTPVQTHAGEGTDVAWLAKLAIVAWNNALLLPDERASIVDEFAAAFTHRGVDPELSRALFAGFATQKRRKFPDDVRHILDHDARMIDGELRVMACVCDGRALGLAKPAKPTKKKRRKELKGLEVRIATPLLAQSSPEHMDVVREFSEPDPDLARVLGNVIAVYLNASRDIERYKLNATLGAIAWNASQLKPDGTERFIQRFEEQFTDDLDPELNAALLRAMVAEKRRQYPYDRRPIAVCTVQVKRDGSRELVVLRAKGKLED
jgi:hypothetical protein